MGEGKKEQLRVGFDTRVRLEFVGSRITSDAGLLAYRELDEQLGLTARADQFLTEQRRGRNVQHELAPLLRQRVTPSGALRRTYWRRRGTGPAWRR